MAKAPVKKQAQSKSGLIDKAAKLSLVAKIIIFVVTAGILGGIFFGLAYLPYKEEADALDRSIAQIKNDVSAQEAALKKHQAVSKLAEPIAGAYQYIQQYLPRENEMPRLVQMVSEIGAKAGLIDGVTLFAPKLPAEVQENYAEIPFTLNLEGEFLKVLAFLYDFSRMNRIVNITQVNIGSPKMVDPQREIFHISVKCAGSTYRALTDEEIAAKNTAATAKKK